MQRVHIVQHIMDAYLPSLIRNESNAQQKEALPTSKRSST